MAGATWVASSSMDRLTRWGGSPPRAGQSVAVLLKVYAKCIDGQDQIAKRRIEDALAESDDAAAPATDDVEDSDDDNTD